MSDGVIRYGGHATCGRRHHPNSTPHRRGRSRSRRWTALTSGSLITALALLGALPWRQMPAQTRPLRVAATPQVRIASSENPEPLIEVLTGATRLPNSQMVVGNRGAYALRLYDSTGRVIRRTAGKGAGPGAVQSLGFLHRCGDTISTRPLIGERAPAFTTRLVFHRAVRFTELPYRAACKAPPATRVARVASEGLLWVQAVPVVASPTMRWPVFAPSGAAAARVSLTTALTVHEIGRTFLLGERTDADTGLARNVLDALSR